MCMYSTAFLLLKRVLCSVMKIELLIQEGERVVFEEKELQQ